MALSFMPYFEWGMEHLIKEELLAPLDFSDLDCCVDCIKGNYVKHIKRVELYVVQVILEIIHTDICGPFNVWSVDGFNSFITFMDDFSRCEYIYPTRERSDVLDSWQDNSYFRVLCSLT
jgi:hypothetical protein